MKQNPSYNASYRSEIDGLRAFAVLSVVIFHAFPSWLTGGFIGVDVFFVISGFLITTHIFDHLDRGKFSFIDFFNRRIRRLFPALIIVVTCSLAFGWFALLADEFAQLGKHIASGAVFITNFVLVNESGYFDNAAETKPMLHLWSLAVEEQFYIVWPLVLWFAWTRRVNLLVITVFVAILSFCTNIYFVETHPTATFFWPFGRFWEILVGSILAWILLYKQEAFNQTRIRVDKFLCRFLKTGQSEADGSIIANILSVLGLALLFVGAIFVSEHLAFPSAWALIPVLGATFIIASGSSAYLNRVLLMNPIAIWFGLISYPLYLWHWPILSYLQIIDSDTQNWAAQVVAVLLSILLAWLTYKFIESPIRFGYLKKRLNSAIIASMLFLVGGVGFLVSITDWSKSHNYENIVFKRAGFDHLFGSSLKWLEGKDDWLFLGNDYGDTIAKLRLETQPPADYTQELVNQFSSLTEIATATNTKVALLVGPNKSSVYDEYLPEELVPSDKRYTTFITEPLSKVPNLKVVDPTAKLRQSKTDQGLLYRRTDTHWNQKGSYIAFKTLLDELGVSYPNVQFSPGGKRGGDLIGISGIPDFPVRLGDNWKADILHESEIVRQNTRSKDDDQTGKLGIVSNQKALNDMSVWVVGDSFSLALRPYIEASFKQVRYVGHWREKLSSLPQDLSRAEETPDLILIVRVERSF